MTDAQRVSGELLPCPFCGSGAGWWQEGNHFVVGCGTCSGLVRRRDRSDANSNWNRRALEKPAAQPLGWIALHASNGSYQFIAADGWTVTPIIHSGNLVTQPAAHAPAWDGGERRVRQEKMWEADNLLRNIKRDDRRQSLGTHANRKEDQRRAQQTAPDAGASGASPDALHHLWSAAAQELPASPLHTGNEELTSERCESRIPANALGATSLLAVCGNETEAQQPVQSADLPDMQTIAGKEYQIRFVAREHIKNKPIEANPSPIRVLLVGDIQRPEGSPQFLTNDEIDSERHGENAFEFDDLMLRAAEAHAQTGKLAIDLSAPLGREVARDIKPVWLLERGQAVNHTPTLWYKGSEGGRGRYEYDWTEDATKANKYTFEKAEEIARTLFGSGWKREPTISVVQHIFLDNLRQPEPSAQGRTPREWIGRIASQYGARQAAALRGDAVAMTTADHWMDLIMRDHWHDLIAMNKELTAVLAERDEAIKVRNEAILENNTHRAERDAANAAMECAIKYPGSPIDALTIVRAHLSKARP